MYSIVWKYTISENNRAAFEAEYGKKGTWSKLFRDSDKYTGSFLHKSSDTNPTYLLIDTWTDEQSYETFKNENREVYERLSAQFENLYTTEEKVGTFHTVD